MAAKKKTKKLEPKEGKKGKYNIGDVVALKNDHKCFCFSFEKGTRVLITDMTDKGYAINDNPDDPENGRTMTECGFEL